MINEEDTKTRTPMVMKGAMAGSGRYHVSSPFVSSVEVLVELAEAAATGLTSIEARSCFADSESWKDVSFTIFLIMESR